MRPKFKNRGFHPVLADEFPYLFIDSCVQVWPDADFADAHRHGVTAYAVTSWWPRDGFAAALEGIMFWQKVARDHQNITIATTAEAIRNAKLAGQAAFILAAQDGEFLEGRLARLEAFHRIGLRLMIPAYNRGNMICDGCLDVRDRGLSRFGQAVVAECNRLGMVIDCTHTGRRATLEIMERSDHPVVFSHSNPRAVVDNPRNIDDEQIRACAAAGGVVGTVCWGPLVFKAGSHTRPSLEDYLDCVDYLADLLGNTQHIGIGTDFSLGSYPIKRPEPWGAPAYADTRYPHDRFVDTWPRSPERFANGFSSYGDLHRVIDGLQRRGYTSDDLKNVFGRNYLRVFQTVFGA